MTTGPSAAAAAPAPAAAPTARRYSRRCTLLLTAATLVAVRGRPTLASAVSRENLAGDPLNEAGTAAQITAALAETANRLIFFMIVPPVDDTGLFLSRLQT